MINETKLIEAMQEGIVLLTYMCLVTNVEKQREVTIAKEFTNNFELPRTIVDNKVICYDVEFRKWHDIEINTIIKWKKIT